MKRTKRNKTVNFAGLLLLAVFVNLYLVQLVCNLPHLVQRLQSITQSHHHSGHGNHHRTESKTSAAGHDHHEHSHHGDQQPASAPEDASCCSELAYAPLLESSSSVKLPSLVKVQFTIMGSLYQAVLRSFYRNLIRAVSHAPPDAPPKIPDIRIFLHSLII
ncbi:hypothetical protein [Pontibacter actiniarum]|uniref:hypothetical protein n=1 Tax=Pontibacter actiniarum TaxID=323450 RepID=UPI00041E1E5D|nr:hypothetical protein [Pontibacter actiniarum]